MADTKLIKELRQRTGAGVLDCRNALREADGDVEKAVEILRKKGLAAAAKKSGRVASEGLVESYIHGNGRIGVLAEVNCETDFVAKTEEFRNLVKDICMQIAASSPQYVSVEDIPAEVLKREKEILREQAEREGKPEHVIEKMVEGRLKKFYSEVCLLEQPYIRDPDKTISQLLTEKIAAIGENIKVRRFVRFELGEGIEKKEDNFAEEVAKMVGQTK